MKLQKTIEEKALERLGEIKSGKVKPLTEKEFKKIMNETDKKDLIFIIGFIVFTILMYYFVGGFN